MSFVSSKGNIISRLILIELYKIFTIINRAIKGLHCIFMSSWNRMEFDVSCRSISWSNEISNRLTYTSLLIPVTFLE